MTNEKKAEILNEFNIDGADQELLDNLKKTINSETSSENGDEIRSKSNSIDIIETKENIVLIKAEPDPELEQEDAKNNEDNESVVSSEPVKEEPKKKRTYKPRKK
jgi:predicted glutamine amidotransferase